MTFQGPPQAFPGAPAPAPAQGAGCKWGLLGCGCPAVALGCFTAIAVFAFGIVYFVFALIKGSGPYTMAVDRAKSDAHVVDALGTPVQEGWWVMGSLKTSNTSGTATLSIPLSGPKASATLSVDATMSSSRWTFRRLAVEVKGGPTIDLLGKPTPKAEAEAPPRASPRASPTGEW